ncbi:hypothetical protein EB155_01030 [archaeon]|nr:hypothetical protein [archaeon]NDB78428.1 hypothetical protein [archaeon]
MISIYFHILFLFFTQFQENDWKTYLSNNLVNIEFKFEECNNQVSGSKFNYYFVKLTNKTSSNVLINFYLSEDSTNDEEMQKKIILNPYSSKKSDCSDKYWRLYFYSEKKLNDLPIKNIEIIEIN